LSWPRSDFSRNDAIRNDSAIHFEEMHDGKDEENPENYLS